MKTLFADPEYRPKEAGPRSAPSPEEEFERLIEQFEMSWNMLADRPGSVVLSMALADRMYDIKHHDLCSASTRAWLVMAFSSDAIAFD